MLNGGDNGDGANLSIERQNSYGKERVHGGVEQRCWSKICCGKILNELIWKGEGRKDIIYLKLSNDHVDPTRFGNFKTR
jgi:hypothetical protein